MAEYDDDDDLDYVVEDPFNVGLFDYFDEELELHGQEGHGRGNELENDDEVTTRRTDTSALEYRNGKDMQGIAWERSNYSRKEYREMRLKVYINYQNLSGPYDSLYKVCKRVDRTRNFYDFHYHTRDVKPTIFHFQLRNLIWATSKHDVYMVQNYEVMHWSSLLRGGKEVLSVAGNILPTHHHGSSSRQLTRVQITSMSVKDNLMVAGGVYGELICKRLNQPGVSGVAFCTKLNDDSEITNSVDICQSSSGSTQVVTGNNDFCVKMFDAETFVQLSCFSFLWSVNSVSTCPDGKLLTVLGDSTDCLMIDPQSGKVIGTLQGHLDYSFACDWHPDGYILATGSQDKTCRLWDVRNTSESLAVLQGRMGAIRGIKFSSDGRFMATAEPADFVHIYDVKTDFCTAQEIDMFGQIAGVSFSPDSDAFFVGVEARTHGGLLEFNRRKQYSYLDSFL